MTRRKHGGVVRGPVTRKKTSLGTIGVSLPDKGQRVAMLPCSPALHELRRAVFDGEGLPEVRGMSTPWPAQMQRGLYVSACMMPKPGCCSSSRPQAGSVCYAWSFRYNCDWTSRPFTVVQPA